MLPLVMKVKILKQVLYSQAIIARGDIKLDGKLDYQEFMLFMLEHERNLWIHFVDLDKDGSGKSESVRDIVKLLNLCVSQGKDFFFIENFKMITNNIFTI